MQWPTKVWGALVAAAAFGAAAAALVLSWPVVRLKVQTRRQSKRIAELEQEIHGLRTLPIAERHRRRLERDRRSSVRDWLRGKPKSAPERTAATQLRSALHFVLAGDLPGAEAALAEAARVDSSSSDVFLVAREPVPAARRHRARDPDPPEPAAARRHLRASCAARRCSGWRSTSAPAGS